MIITVAAVLIAAGAALFWAARSRTQPPVDAALPVFVFDSTGLGDWWSPGSHPPQPEEPNWPEGLGASLTVFEGQEQAGGDCHISFFHWNKSTDPETARKDRTDLGAFAGNGRTLAERAIKVLPMQTPEGEKTYELYQYEVTGGGSEPIKRGVQLGYLPLEDSYIEIQSHCATYEGLAKTLPVLPAVDLRISGQTSP